MIPKKIEVNPIFKLKKGNIEEWEKLVDK